MQGLRRDYHRTSPATFGENARFWFANIPTLTDLERGYRDGFAGVEPQP